MVYLSVYCAQKKDIALVVRKASIDNCLYWEFIRWDMENDLFTPGQWLVNKQLWLKGSAISPNGELFFYIYNTYQNPNQRNRSHVILSNLPNASAKEYRAYDDIGRFYPCSFTTDNQPIWPKDDGIPSERGLMLSNEWTDPRGRRISVRESSIFANDELLYDTADHHFTDRSPGWAKHD